MQLQCDAQRMKKRDWNHKEFDEMKSTGQAVTKEIRWRQIRTTAWSEKKARRSGIDDKVHQDQISSTSLSSLWSVSVIQNHSLEQCMQISHLDHVVDRIQWLYVPSARSLWVHHAMAIVAVVITTVRHQLWSDTIVDGAYTRLSASEINSRWQNLRWAIGRGRLCKLVFACESGRSPLGSFFLLASRMRDKNVAWSRTFRV